MADKLPTWKAMLPLALSIYKRNGVGCCWHITLDDGNLDNHNVAFCAEQARASGHADCIALIELMVHASKTQRGRLYNCREMRSA